MSSFMSEFKHLIIPLEKIRVATNNFGEGNFIAEGGYGKVYRGEFFGPEGRIIGAVKRWTLPPHEGDPEFQREIMLLSDNKHENLISLLGFCYEDHERILVYEYAPNTSLNYHVQDPNFTWIQRLKVCLGAARGLEYLHNPKRSERVLHCDIKSANIMLDENWKAKIADFGLSKYGPANTDRSYLITQAKGTLGYCDPAFLETMIYTKESDVYSFGVVLFEVLCSRMCIDYQYNDNRRSLMSMVKELSNELIRDTILDVNLRQQMSAYSFDYFLTVAHHCLEPEQKQRPSMDLVVRELETALHYQLTGEHPDDAIIRWSSGREGNYIALVSTLQDILGPEWEPIPLTVTRHVRNKQYGEAIDNFRPQQLQKRRASITEKYICGKVIEIVKNAKAGHISKSTLNKTPLFTPIDTEESDRPINTKESDRHINTKESDRSISREESYTPIYMEELDRPIKMVESERPINTNESDGTDFKTLLSLWESRKS